VNNDYLDMNVNYMAAFQEGKGLVVYLYDSKEMFIQDVQNLRFDGKRVRQTGILEGEIPNRCFRDGLLVRYVDCRN